MLTKFLLMNNFPASCFFAPWGSIKHYTFQNNQIVLVKYNGSKATANTNSLPLMTISIPKPLFRIHMSIYKNIIKQLEKTSLFELMKKNELKAGSWGTDLEQNILSNLANNIILPIALHGVILDNGYGYPKGEGVYVLSSTDNFYKVKTVDGGTFDIKKKHLEIIPSSDITSFVKKWNKILIKIEEEYEEFCKQN